MSEYAATAALRQRVPTYRCAECGWLGTNVVARPWIHARL